MRTVAKGTLQAFSAAILLFVIAALTYAHASALPKGFAGTWYFDMKNSSKAAKNTSERNITMHFQKTVFTFKNDGTFQGPDGMKGTIKIVNSNKISILLSPGQEMTFENRGELLRSSMKWSDSLTIHPYYSKSVSVKKNIDHLNKLYKSAEKIDGSYSYCMFTGDDYFVCSSKPFNKATKKMKSHNPNKYIIENSKAIINGGIMTASFEKNGFLLENNGLKVRYALSQ